MLHRHTIDAVTLKMLDSHRIDVAMPLPLALWATAARPVTRAGA